MAFTQKFPRVYNITDFGQTANVACQPAQWAEIGRVTVPAQQQVTFGIGMLGNTDSREVCYLRIDDASTVQIHGKVRFLLADANQKNTIMVAEQRTERLSASQTSKTDGFLLGEYPARAGQDSLLLIQIYIDGASAKTMIYNGTNTKYLIPVTVYQ